MLIYGGVGVSAYIKGGLFLDYTALTGSVGSGQHIGIILVELGVGVTVTSVMLALFHAFADLLRIIHNVDATCRNLELFDCHLADDDWAVSCYFTRKSGEKAGGLSIFQTSVFLFYITLGRVSGGTAPILTDAPDTLYSNPLPHVLILTAIVVGVRRLRLGWR